MTVEVDRAGERGRLGAAVKELRVARGPSQQELADASGIHRVMLVRFEQGKRNLGVSNLRALVDALGDDGDRVLRDLMAWTAKG